MQDRLKEFFSWLSELVKIASDSRSSWALSTWLCVHANVREIRIVQPGVTVLVTVLFAFCASSIISIGIVHAKRLHPRRSPPTPTHAQPLCRRNLCFALAALSYRIKPRGWISMLKLPHAAAYLLCTMLSVRLRLSTQRG
mmetsp:Transcript_10282/g.17262  ORF Transcript_10282/g.17262 Transcript_10282/m.17262 type:complete len:140 (-) Transcript_10282:605-1024(-)